MEISWKVHGATALRADLIGLTPRVERQLAKAVVTSGQQLLTSIRGHASGRPGPRAITGNYRRSWNMRLSGTTGRISAEIGTNAPQARRLEYGFVGVDRLGRVYNQPPYPHVQPAADQIERTFYAACEAAVGREVR